MSENGWLFPTVEVLHLIGMAWWLGPILLRDLGVLGWVPRVEVRQYSRAAIALALVTGALLFSADSGRYVHNPAFLVKLGLLAAAIATHVVLHAKETRATAALSLALWSVVILAGRAVIDFDA